jgi:hypothetical protein
MKKIYFSAFLLASLASNAQIFTEDFDSGIPSTWTIIDNDGKTPNSAQANLQTAGWHAITQTGKAGNTSWYNPAGAADDWLITPQITIPAGASNPFFLYDVRSPDANYPNDYKVLVSTTGTAMSDFTAVTGTLVPTSTETTQGVDLSAYAGQSIYVAIQDVSNDKFVIFIDNVKVVELEDKEISLESVAYNKYVGIPNTQSLDVVVKNNGAQNITAYTINWSYGGNDYSHNVTGVNLAYNETHNQTVDLDVTVANAGALDFTVELDYTGDADLTNNDGEGTIYGLTEIPAKRVVLEEATGTWCGWCPRGAVALDDIEAAEGDNVIGIAVHNGDPMAVAEHDGNMQVSGYPSANGDRLLRAFDPGNFQQAYDVLKNNVSPADVKITATYDAAANEVTVTPTITFKTNLTGDYSVSVIALEDWVHGTGSGYNQANYYANNQAGAMGGYESLPNPVPAADMYYRHVSRGFVNGGFEGDNSVIPNTVVAETGYTTDYTYTIPSSVAAGHLQFAVIVIDNENGTILNGEKTHGITNIVGVEEFSGEFSLTPNPTNDVFTLTSSTDVEATVRIVNSLGQVVDTYVNNTLLNGSTYDVSNYDAGVYFVTITEGNKIATKRLVINK